MSFALCRRKEGMLGKEVALESKEASIWRCFYRENAGAYLKQHLSRALPTKSTPIVGYPSYAPTETHSPHIHMPVVNALLAPFIGQGKPLKNHDC